MVVPGALSATGVGFLLAVVWPLGLYDGPQWGLWYEKWGGAPSDDGLRQMLADLLESYALNKELTTRKGTYFKAGFLLTFIGLGVAVIVTLTR